MVRSIFIFVFCFLFVSCVPQSTQTRSESAPSHALVGDWMDENGTHFSLDEDGMLGMPGQTARSGLTWSTLGDVLLLRTLDMPGGIPREDRMGIVHVSASRLELRAPDGHAKVWRKSRDAVKRLDGTLFYRERMALPPEVVVSTQLFLAGRDVPLASSLALAAGQTPLSFRIYYLAKDVGQSANVMLQAAVLHESNSLFATAEPVAVSLTDSPSVLLQRTMPGDVGPGALSTPVQFQGIRKNAEGTSEVTLYLEPDDLYLLHLKRDGKNPVDDIRAGSWKQIDRNHTIQLRRGESAPLTAALRPAGSLLLEMPGVPGGEIELKPVVFPLPERSFRVTGMFRLEKGVLSECPSGLDFSVRASGADYAALEAAYRKEAKNGEPLLVEVEGLVRHRNGAPAPSRASHAAKAGAEDIHVLEITRFIAAHPGKTCAEPYASAPLFNTYWRLMSLNGKPAQAFPDQSEPHLILRDKQQAAGSDGCNNFFMQWKGQGNDIAFTGGGSTLMMCPQGMEQGAEMMKTLTQADAWGISGSVLELRKKGKPLATFEAVSL